MTESTLSLSLNDIEDRISDFLGWGYDYSNPSKNVKQQHIIHDCLLSGLRRFYYPPPVNGRVWSWRFLKPVTTIVLWEAVALDDDNPILTAVYSSPSTTITATSAAFHASMVTKSLVITGVGTYSIASYTSSTVVVVTGDASGAHAASKTFSIACDGNYQLPDDFGSIIGHLTFGADTGYPPVMVCGEAQIRAMRQRDVDHTGRTRYVAIRPKAFVHTGQRFELMAYPIPDADYTLSYQYNAFPNKYTTEGSDYPLGGMQHGETILESCLAIAEQRYDDSESTNHQDEFLRRLAASIDIDQKAGPQWLGYGADGSGDDPEPLARTTRVSVGGVYY